MFAVVRYMENSSTKKNLAYTISNIKAAKWLMLIIPLLFITLTMVISLLNIFERSIFDSNGFTLEYLKRVMTEPLYTKVLFTTLRTGVVVTLCTVIIAYPMAYLSVRSKNSAIRRVVSGGVLVPYWVSMLVRIFAWQIILAKNGILNMLLIKLGVIDEPLVLMYTSIAVVISLTHILLPQMFLSMQAVMAEIDPNLTLAAEGMGARPVKNFTTVFMPLSVSGVISGCMMVFVLALGFYIAPALLGGSEDMMVSNLIQQNMDNMNWNIAAALSVELFVIVMVLIAIAYKFVGDKLFRRS
jgi:putative spermidine/putrescine transport system permease protein/spermidine/putrescine transport system permease protein